MNYPKPKPRKLYLAAGDPLINRLERDATAYQKKKRDDQSWEDHLDHRAENP